MITGFQIIVLVFAMFALSRAFLRAKDKQITKGEAAFWLIIWFMVIILVFIPWPAITLTNYLGIGRPVDLLVYLSIIFLFYMMFRIYVKVDKTEQNITELVRKIAIDKVKEPQKKERKKR